MKYKVTVANLALLPYPTTTHRLTRCQSLLVASQAVLLVVPLEARRRSSNTHQAPAVSKARHQQQQQQQEEASKHKDEDHHHRRRRCKLELELLKIPLRQVEDCRRKGCQGCRRRRSAAFLREEGSQACRRDRCRQA